MPVKKMRIPPDTTDFASYFMGGFECSSHRLPNGRRVDTLDSSGHDRYAAQDYAALYSVGLRTCRDGLRWPHIEPKRGTYIFHSIDTQIQAAHECGIQVIWDLMHYGYPDFLCPFSDGFDIAFAEYALAACTYLSERTKGTLWICPINEISFFAWAGGQTGEMAPFACGKGHELKICLARAVIRAMQLIRRNLPQTRFIHAEPLIAVQGQYAAEVAEAKAFHRSQFEALDILSGRLYPALGGNASFIDIVGVNYYPANQWIHHTDHQARQILTFSDEKYVPLSNLLLTTQSRYGRPLLITETGAEGDDRAPWLRYVSSELVQALAMGVDVRGICLYPVMDHPGWVDDRYCPNGLFSYPDERGHRTVNAALLTALQESQTRVKNIFVENYKM